MSPAKLKCIQRFKQEILGVNMAQLQNGHPRCREDVIHSREYWSFTPGPPCCPVGMVRALATSHNRREQY